MSRQETPAPPVRLVTGHTGFVGRHALAAWHGSSGLVDETGGSVDIRDAAGVKSAIRRIRPDSVVHLAGVSFVPESVADPRKTYEVNFLGTLNLLQALDETGFTGRFLFVGSGDAYGLVNPESLPIRETLPLRPRNPYAVSKAACEALCYQWSQTGRFEVVMARPFNHIGPGQDPRFALSDFARQVAEMAAGRRDPVLRVGNLEVTRDFCDVRDVVRAYDLLLAHGTNGESYNVCSGQEFRLRGLLEELLRIAGVRAEIQVDPARWRAADQPRVWASHEKLRSCTGWQPQHSITDTLLNLYRYWEKEIG